MAQDIPLFTTPSGGQAHILLRCYVLHFGLSPWPHSLFKEWFVAISFRGSPEFEGLAYGTLCECYILDDYITDYHGE
jgi:hypothetical protein